MARAQAEAEERARLQAEQETQEAAGLMGWIKTATGVGKKEEEEEADLSAVLQTGLSRFSKPNSNTETYQKACYAWRPSDVDAQMSDDALIQALKTRLKYVHTTAPQALSAVVGEPNIVKNPNAFGEKGVDAAVFRAFASQLMYNLSEERASQFLTNASGSQKAPLVSVPKFLNLFTATGAGADGRGAKAEKIAPVSYTVDKLTDREQRLLLTMRDYLFEQHSQMKNMFKRCDPDGNGYVSIEEFLNAMSRAGVPVGHGLDRRSDKTISEEEAARIVGFFDKEGDGYLRYHEFMTMLQSTKNSVLTKKVLTNR